MICVQRTVGDMTGSRIGGGKDWTLGEPVGKGQGEQQPWRVGRNLSEGWTREGTREVLKDWSLQLRTGLCSITLEKPN